jgi:hypothetical protein
MVVEAAEVELGEASEAVDEVKTVDEETAAVVEEDAANVVAAAHQASTLPIVAVVYLQSS